MALAAMAARPARAAATDLRVVSLDWTLASIAVELGAPPLGVAEIASYARWVGAPALPAGTVELGLRTDPGFEGLMQLRPGLIMASVLNTAAQSRLESIAPVLMNTIYPAEGAPLARARAMTLTLGDRLGRAAEAAASVRNAEDALSRAGVAVGSASRPVLPLHLLDPHHMLFYGGGSLYADVLAAMGLRSALAGPTGPWGSTSGSFDTLVRTGPAEILVMAPVKPDCEALIAEGGFLARIAAAQGSRIHRLPATWPFGALSAATRFATHVRAALTPQGE